MHRRSPGITRPRISLAVSASIVALVGLTSCGPAPTQSGISDPYEAQNRKIYESSVRTDKAILRPVALAVGKVLPPKVQIGVTNFADNLELPGRVVNDLLQANLEMAAQNTVRFAINSTFGLAGLLDPATKLGAPGKKTDFGETLHIWGVGEGNYVVVPLIGPSTDRDMLGKVVDVALDPLRLIVPKPAHLGFGANVAAKIIDRGRYSETVDSILYDSADGYAQARLLYLQNRRYQLGETPPDASFEDPYAK
ncbi:MAG: VacJ family lipoprotein [Paracoccaceae bacterium]